MDMPVAHGGPASAPVTLRTFASESEAAVTKAALEAFDIDCVLSSDDCGGQRPSLAMANGIRLIVNVRDIDAALDVLANVADVSE
jgi:hypothetical protein